MRELMAHLFLETEDTEDSVYPVTINEIAEAQRQDEKWNFMMTLWAHYDSTVSLDDSDRPNSGVNSNFSVASVPQSSSEVPLMRELMAHLFLETEDT